jgi:hypothetical protein
VARARNIKPGFFTNEELVELPFSTRLLFIGLWTLADREGRLEDKPKRIKMHLFPADEIDVDEALSSLQKSGFLKRYEVDGARYIQVLAFRKHQNPHRDEKPSSIPPEGGHGANTVQAPCEHSANPADSPIPDSPIPETSTGYSAATQPELGEQTPAARADDDPDLHVQLSIAMRRAGIESQPADPRLIALAEQGVTPQTVAAACAEAKQAKPGERIGVAYVVAILNRWSADAAKVNAGHANQPRGSPRQALQANTQRLLNRIQGTTSHEPDHRIIDLNERPA